MRKMLVTSIFSNPTNIFQRLLSQGCKKSELCGKGLPVIDSEENDFEKNLRKGEKADYHHFPFLTMFSSIPWTNQIIWVNLNLVRHSLKRTPEKNGYMHWPPQYK